MDQERLHRALDYERDLLLDASTDVAEASFGRVVTNRGFPGALSHNVVLVEKDVGGQALLEESRALLAESCVEWASIWASDEGWAERVEEDLRAVGYRRSVQLYMALSSRPEKAAGFRAERVAYAKMRPSIVASWMRTGRTEENSGALADRSTSYAQACELSYFGVPGDGTYRSFCEVVRRGPVGQIDNVVTDPVWQGRGHATAVVLEACRYLTELECKLVFLCTDADDWPQTLYRRLGFSDIGHRSKFE